MNIQILHTEMITKDLLLEMVPLLSKIDLISRTKTKTTSLHIKEIPIPTTDNHLPLTSMMNQDTETLINHLLNNSRNHQEKQCLEIQMQLKEAAVKGDFLKRMTLGLKITQTSP